MRRGGKKRESRPYSALKGVGILCSSACNSPNTSLFQGEKGCYYLAGWRALLWETMCHQMYLAKKKKKPK
jgi:hypothetical protein